MRWAPAFGMALLAFACERFETAGSPPSAVASPAGDDGDAAAIDASAADGSSSSVLLLSADFEGATGGECGGKTWDSYQSTSDVVAGGRVGTNACRFCGDPGETEFTINSPLFAPARTGDKIVGHAWFRLAAPGSVKVALVIRARPSRVETNDEGMHVTTTDWVELTAELDIPATVPSTDQLDAYVLVNEYANPASPPCALADAIEIRRKE